MKNRVVKNISKKIISLILTLTISISMLLMPTAYSQAGLIANVIAGKWSTIAINTIERTTLYCIGKAEDASTDETLTKVLTTTKRILSGSQSVVNSQLLEMCSEMSAELSSLYNVVTTRTNEIDEYLKNIDQDIIEEDFNEQQDYLVDTFYIKYKKMVCDYQELLDALVEYGNNPDVGIGNLKAAYTNLYNSYYEQNPNSGSGMIKEFNDDLTDFLLFISPYDPTEDEWTRLPELTSKTYLDYVFKYLTTVTSFENNLYDGMTATINQVVGIGYEYIQAYRYYAEIESMFISSDSSLNESEIRSKTKTVWDNFNKQVELMKRGINQMCSLYEDDLNTYMRSYDTLVKIKLEDYKTKQNIVDAYAPYPDIQSKLEGSDYSNTTLYAVDETAGQYVYQFKLYNDTSNKVYAVRNSKPDEMPDNASQELYDKTNKPFYAASMIEYDVDIWGDAVFNDNSCFSLNYLNLTKNSASPAGYSMIKSGSELAPIVSSNNKAYIRNNATLIDYFNKELSLTYGSQNVFLPEVELKSESSNEDDLKSGQFLLLNTDIEWNPTATFGSDADTTWLNISMPLSSDGLTGHQVKIDCEDDIYDKRDTVGQVVAMYTADPKVRLGVYGTKANDGADGETIISLEGCEQITSNSYVFSDINSGKLLTIKAKPNEGSTIKSIVLKDENSNVLDVILDDITQTLVEIRDADGVTVRTEDEGYTLTQADLDAGYTAQTVTNTTTVQEILENGALNEDGYFEFKLPVPCQNANVYITYDNEDSTLYTYPVTLNDVKTPGSTDSYDAVLQFAGYDYLSTKEFKQGEEVTFSVTPYDNTVCSGVTLTDLNGDEIKNIIVTDITDESLRIRPNERIFRFTMPAQAVTVDAQVKQAYEVTVVDDHSIHKFKDLDCFDVFSLIDGCDKSFSWERSDQITFAPNTKVSLDIIPDANYQITRIDVFDESRNKIDVMLTGENGISFIMPESNVSIQVSSTRISSDYFNATLKDEIGWSNFINSYDNKLNVNTNIYQSGETVRFEVGNANILPNNISIVDNNDNPLDVALARDADNAYIYSFVMPNKNVFINVSYDDASIALNEESFNIYAGQTHNLVATLSDNFADKSVLWTSSDENIATVDQNGVVTGVSTGKATITALSALNFNYYDTAEVNVRSAFVITNYEELCAFANGVNLGILDYTVGNFELGNDIACPDGCNDFIPVGTPENPFKGTFDGCGYTISNLSIEVNENYKGLFGYVDGATIENVSVSGVINCTEMYAAYIGVLAGYATGGTVIRNVSVDGEINCTDKGGMHFGGLVGYVANETVVKNIYSDVDIRNNTSATAATFRLVGGVIGTVEASTVDRCIYTGTNRLYDCYDSIAGIVGTVKVSGNITNCANLGNVTIIQTNAIALMSAPYMAGIVASVDGSAVSSLVLQNCYNYGRILLGTPYTENVGAIVGKFGTMGDYSGYATNVKNNYFLDSSASYGVGSSNWGTPDGVSTVKSEDEFASGEVAYLLNSGVTDGTQVWYQNIDNGKTPDDYPVLANNNENTVYKVDLENKTYSNYPAKSPSKLEQIDLRTYQRIYENGSLSPKSQIAYGYGKIDEENKTITLYMADTAERIGILMHQGENGSKGIMTLEGDYPKFSETSDVLIREGREVPVYTDGNGCIFIANPETTDGIPTEFTLSYTEKPVDDHTPTLYTLKIEVIEAERFEEFGASIGGYMVSSLSKDDPDYKVLHFDDDDTDIEDETDIPKTTDEDIDNNKNTNVSKTSPQTGNDFFDAALFSTASITFLAFALVCKRKRRKNI